MGFSDLVAKLGFDISSFQQNLGTALTGADKLGAKFEGLSKVLCSLDNWVRGLLVMRQPGCNSTRRRLLVERSIKSRFARRLRTIPTHGECSIEVQRLHPREPALYAIKENQSMKHFAAFAFRSVLGVSGV